MLTLEWKNAIINYKTIDVFNKDEKKILKISFKTHHDKINLYKIFLNSLKITDDNDDFDVKKNISPKFIQSYEKKNRKKL